MTTRGKKRRTSEVTASSPVARTRTPRPQPTVVQREDAEAYGQDATNQVPALEVPTSDDRYGRHITGELPGPEPEPTIGRYTLKRQIGRGSTSNVYLAEHQETGDRVAIKLFSTGGTYIRSCVRAVHIEAARLSRAASPHVVAVHEVIETPAWVAMVMDYHDGTNLRDRIERRGRMSVTSALSVTLQLAEALRATHRAGIVHRDLKPSNVIVTDDITGALYAVLSDFGVAKADDEGADPTPDGFYGTPAFAAPEQSTAPTTVGPAADLYGLGGVFYYMLTGKPPFMKRAGATLVDQHLSVPFPEIERRHVNDPRVRQVCNKLLWRLTAKSPTARLGSAGETIAAIIATMDAVGIRPPRV